MTDSGAIMGRDVILSMKVDDEFYPVGCGVACSFELDQEIILRTGVNDGLFPKKRVRRSDWRGSVSGVTVYDSSISRITPFYLLQEAVRRAEHEWEFEFTDISGNIKTITGVAIIKSENLSGDVSAFSKFDLQIEGTGGFVLDDASSPGECLSDNVDSDYWTTTLGQSAISGTSNLGKSLIGKHVLSIARNGIPYVPVTTGSATGLFAKFVSATGTISFDPNVPFEAGELIWVMFRDE